MFPAVTKRYKPFFVFIGSFYFVAVSYFNYNVKYSLINSENLYNLPSIQKELNF